MFKQYVTAVVRHVTETVPPNSPKWMGKGCNNLLLLLLLLIAAAVAAVEVGTSAG